MAKYGIEIRTSRIGGRYQHKVRDIGEGLSDEAVEALKTANEMVWEEMPEYSKDLVSKIIYKAPNE